MVKVGAATEPTGSPLAERIDHILRDFTGDKQEVRTLALELTRDGSSIPPTLPKLDRLVSLVAAGSAERCVAGSLKHPLAELNPQAAVKILCSIIAQNPTPTTVCGALNLTAELFDHHKYGGARGLEMPANMANALTRAYLTFKDEAGVREAVMSVIRASHPQLAGPMLVPLTIDALRAGDGAAHLAALNLEDYWSANAGLSDCFQEGMAAALRARLRSAQNLQPVLGAILNARYNLRELAPDVTVLVEDMHRGAVDKFNLRSAYGTLAAIGATDRRSLDALRAGCKAGCSEFDINMAAVSYLRLAPVEAITHFDSLIQSSNPAAQLAGIACLDGCEWHPGSAAPMSAEHAARLRSLVRTSPNTTVQTKAYSLLRQCQAHHELADLLGTSTNQELVTDIAEDLLRREMGTAAAQGLAEFIRTAELRFPAIWRDTKFLAGNWVVSPWKGVRFAESNDRVAVAAAVLEQAERVTDPAVLSQMTSTLGYLAAGTSRCDAFFARAVRSKAFELPGDHQYGREAGGWARGRALAAWAACADGVDAVWTAIQDLSSLESRTRLGIATYTPREQRYLELGIQTAAAHLLAKGITEPRYSEALKIITRSDVPMAEATVEALMDSGARADHLEDKILQAVLDDRDQSSQRTYFRYLAQHGSPRIVPTLERALEQGMNWADLLSTYLRLRERHGRVSTDQRVASSVVVRPHAVAEAGVDYSKGRVLGMFRDSDGQVRLYSGANDKNAGKLFEADGFRIVFDEVVEDVNALAEVEARRQAALQQERSSWENR